MNASKPTKAAFFNYIGSIELPIDIIEMCPASGAADSAIAEMRKFPEVIAELNGINPDKLRLELKEYGAWDETELSDRDSNLDRILWIACLDIQENMFNESEQ